MLNPSLDWFKGKSTGNHGFYHQIQGFPVKISPSSNSMNPETMAAMASAPGRWTKTWYPLATS